MASKTTILGNGATCVRCHKKIGKGQSAYRGMTGLSNFYLHPHCYKPGYTMWHGRYVKKSSIK